MGVLVVAVALFAVWGFYGAGTWGWCLVKGYNITFAEWFNPLHPYQWPKGGPAMVPAGSVFPTGKGGQAATAARVQVA